MSAAHIHLAPDAPVLEARGISIQFGGLKAVSDFEIAVCPGELVGMIGPNGAGKTTVFNLLTGVYRPAAGQIALAGRRIDGMKPNRIVSHGLARTFQNIRLFRELTALDNVRIACRRAAPVSWFGAITRTNRYFAEEQDIAQRALQLLDYLDLGHRRRELARNLPYGDQRRLEIARALATGPRILLLDEPAAGMNPNEKIELMRLIRKLRDDMGLAILLIEHDIKLVMGVCERVTVLDYGIQIAHGTPVEVRRDPKVIEAYFGRHDD